MITYHRTAGRSLKSRLRKAGSVRTTSKPAFFTLILWGSCIVSFCAMYVAPAASQEASTLDAPVFYGYVKIGVAAIDQSGDAATTIEAYNVSKGLTFSKILLNGKMGKHNSVSFDIENVTAHQLNGSLEFAASELLILRFDGSRLRYLRPGAGNPEFARETKGISGSLTPQKWLKLYGGASFQEKRGDRVALLTDGLDFPGTRYDYSTDTRNAGGQMRWKGRSIELAYEWRRFESEGNSLLDRDRRRLNVSAHGPIVDKVSFSASYAGEKSIFDKTGAVLDLKSYFGTLTFIPTKFLSISGHVNHKNAEDDITRVSSRILALGGKASVRFHKSFTAEGGYEYGRRTSEPDVIGTADGKRELSTNAMLAGMTLRLSDRTRLILRYRTRTADRSKYEGLTGPFDLENFISKLEGWGASYAQYSVAFEDRERSNDELMSSGRTRGITTFLNLTPSLGQYPPNLRLSGSAFRGKFTEPHGDFVTDNLLLSARLRYTFVRGLSAEAGITHVDVRKDLNIRKDIAVASVQYEFVSGYGIELRYDLFSYDDLVNYRGNYAGNVVTLNFSKKFGSDYSGS